MLRHLTLSVLILSSFLTFAQKDLTTWYEISGKKETPRYSETMEFCKALRDASPMVHFVSFGISPQGRELPLLILDRQGLSDPLSIRKNGKAIVLVQACIHPGESEGKDAGFLFIRDIITGKLPVQLLDRVSVLFIPIFNVDGHERFGPYNRINQNGPKEMGWRTTAVNLNLNRDYLKAEAPEMQAWLKLFNEWNPDFFIDIHTTDGADYQYSITYHMELLDGVDAGIAGYSKDFLSQWTKNLNERGVLNFTYVTFRNWFNPKSGLITGQTSPMF
jgi:murein tripeptide amidase MpaA